MIKIALRRPDNIAYIIDDLGMHHICVGFAGDETEYTCRQRFPLNKQEREALGTLGRLGKVSEDREEAIRQHQEVLALVAGKSAAARQRGGASSAADLPALAGRIAQVVADSPKWDKGSLKRPWYMMNIDNPVVDKLLDRFRMKCGLPRDTPLSDQERLTFELQLLHPGVLKEVEAAVTMAEEDNRHFLNTG